MTLTQDLELWTLIVNASIVVKAVMALLLAVSFLSWMFIFRKWFGIRRARAQTDTFEREFWSGNDLQALYQGAVNARHTIGSLERIFEAGFREFAKLRSGQRAAVASDMRERVRHSPSGIARDQPGPAGCRRRRPGRGGARPEGAGGGRQS